MGVQHFFAERGTSSVWSENGKKNLEPKLKWRSCTAIIFVTVEQKQKIDHTTMTLRNPIFEKKMNNGDPDGRFQANVWNQIIDFLV